MTRALVCGWPSVPGGEATAGDLLTMEQVADTLEGLGLEVELATNDGFPWGIDAGAMPADSYEHVVVVCGPLHGEGLARLIERFPAANRIAVNVSIVDEAFARRFHHVVSRDSAAGARPDLSFARRPGDVPVIGVVRSHPQPEYPASDLQRVHENIRLALASRDCAAVDFDTRVHPAADPLAPHARSSAAVCALASRMDAVVTTRLHGAVLSLAQGTPVVAIDPIGGGAKVAAQMKAIDWPSSFRAEEAASEQIAEAVEWCLTEEARESAKHVAATAASVGDQLRDQLAVAVGRLDRRAG